MLGLDDEPGYLQGYGPIIAAMARDVAATGTWRCAIVNGRHGTLEGLGTSTYTPGYTPSARLRRHLSTRDRTCRIAGCNARASICEADHRDPYPHGATCECNTDLLCKHHHRIKHETAFQVRVSTDPEDPPGTLIRTTPGGREHRLYPEPLCETGLSTAHHGPGPASDTSQQASAGTGADAAHDSGTTAPTEGILHGHRTTPSDSRPDNGPPPF
jgi:hypothetical protein